MSIVFFNGNFVNEEEAKVSINDAGYYYGDGFYEVILLRNGKLIDNDLHLNRLMKNFDTLYFKNYPTKDEILANVFEVIKQNGKTNGSIYLQFTRGNAPRTHEFLDLNLKPNILIKINDDHYNGFEGEIKTRTCCIFEDPRRLHCEIKMISLLPMVLAKYEAEKNGFQDVIFFNSRIKSITEGSSFNVFIVDDNGTIITCPDGNHILPGCTKNRVISIIKENNYKFEERFYSKKELYDAKEVFLTASLKIDAITKVDNKYINNGVIGNITKDIRNKYRNFIDSYTDE